MKKRQNLYLGGAYHEQEYRNYAKSKYSEYFDLVDPIADTKIIFDKFGVVRQDVFLDLYPSITKEIIDYIVESDKQCIDNCDGLVAFIQEKSFGTIMEIMYAYEKHKPVYTITTNPLFINDFWLKYHTTKFFTTIDDCMNAILNAEGVIE